MLPSFTPEWAHALVVLFCVATGVLVGFFTSMWVKFGLFILGGWLGCTSGMMIYNAIISQIIGKTSSAEILFLVFLTVCIIAGGIITTKLYTHALAIGSSLVGAYAIVRVSLLIIKS